MERGHSIWKAFSEVEAVASIPGWETNAELVDIYKNYLSSSADLSCITRRNSPS